MGALLEEATADSKWTQRDLANSDVFDYDLNDQVIAVKLNVPNPESTLAGNPTIIYDWNGNRSWFTPYRSNASGVINNLTSTAAATGKAFQHIQGRRLIGLRVRENTGRIRDYDQNVSQFIKKAKSFTICGLDCDRGRFASGR